MGFYGIFQNENNNLDDDATAARPTTRGTVNFDEFAPPDSIFSTAVDEWTLDAARTRVVQDAQTDTRSELAKVMTEKLRAL